MSAEHKPKGPDEIVKVLDKVSNPSTSSVSTLAHHIEEMLVVPALFSYVPDHQSKTVLEALDPSSSVLVQKLALDLSFVHGDAAASDVAILLP